MSRVPLQSMRQTCTLLLLQGGEKEYYLASACKQVFVPPTAGFTLRGFKVAGAAIQSAAGNALSAYAVQVELLVSYRTA